METAFENIQDSEEIEAIIRRQKREVFPPKKTLSNGKKQRLSFGKLAPMADVRSAQSQSCLTRRKSSSIASLLRQSQDKKV